VPTSSWGTHHRFGQRVPRPGDFWDWALLELLLTNGLRIEEVSEPATLGVLKRELPYGTGGSTTCRTSNPRNTITPESSRSATGSGGSSLVIIGPLKVFYHCHAVPACDGRDNTSKTPLLRAPASYLLQGAGHPSAMSTQTIRQRLPQQSPSALDTPTHAVTARLPTRVRHRASQQQHPGPRDRRPVRARWPERRNDLRQRPSMPTR
jgi:hypothetical protein